MSTQLPNQYVRPFAFRERTVRCIYLGTSLAVAVSVFSAALGVEWPGPWSGNPQVAARAIDRLPIDLPATPT